MKHFFLHDSNGRIAQAGFCSDDDFQYQVQPGLVLAEGRADPFTDYLSAGVVKPIGPKPSDEHVFDYSAGVWLDPRTLADHKAEKWAQFKRLREAAAVAPLMATRFGTFDAAPKDMANIKDTLAGLNAAEALGMTVEPVRWTMADENTERYVTLTLAELREVAVLLLARGNEAHVYSRTLYDQIEAANTPEELADVIWTVPH